MFLFYCLKVIFSSLTFKINQRKKELIRPFGARPLRHFPNQISSLFKPLLTKATFE